MNIIQRLRNRLRLLWMPGSDIFTRRRVRLEKFWRAGARDVLDAGFGNGWFAYRAYRSGAQVTGVALPDELVRKARSFYNDYLGVPESELHFRRANLYDLPALGLSVDEIICYETLEHIRDDKRVCENFFAALRPGGALHLCCPNAEHPRWCAEQLDTAEQGGHVRYGYTVPTYRELLEPIGFSIEAVEGVGGSILVFLQERVQSWARRCFGEAGAAAVCLVAIPFIWFDCARPKAPFSIYVRARKSRDAE